MIMASCDMWPVAAVHPKSGGNAPGIAPTKTAMGPTLFSGVYTKLYKIMERIDSSVVNRLVNSSNMITPVDKQIIQNAMASLTDRRPVGKGRFFVRVINLSRSFSMI